MCRSVGERVSREHDDASMGAGPPRCRKPAVRIPCTSLRPRSRDHTSSGTLRTRRASSRRWGPRELASPGGRPRPAAETHERWPSLTCGGLQNAIYATRITPLASLMSLAAMRPLPRPGMSATATASPKPAISAAMGEVGSRYGRHGYNEMPSQTTIPISPSISERRLTSREGFADRGAAE